MGLCERIKTERVIYDEGLLSINDTETIDFTNVLSGTDTISAIVSVVTEVTARECDLDLSATPAMSLSNVSFFVVKTITYTTVSGGTTQFQKQVSFNTPAATILLGKSIASPPTTGGIYFPAEDQKRALCEIYNVSATDAYSLAGNIMTDNLTITFTVKIVVADQLVVTLAPVSYQVTA